MERPWNKLILYTFVIGFWLSPCEDANGVSQTIDVQEPSTTTELKITPIKTPSKTKSPSTQTPVTTKTPIGVIAETKTLDFSKSTQRLGDAISFSVVVVDIDLDRDNDIFFANYSSPSQLWLNDGNGVFSDSHQVFGPPNAQGAHGVGIRDLNGDKYPDIFLIYHGDSSKVFFNDGSGGFADSQQRIGTANDNPQDIVMGDVDNDGDIDAFITFSRLANRLWINDGEGHFERSDFEYGGRTSHQMLVMDFNGDEIPDLFYCYIDKPGEIWINDGQGNFVNSRQDIGDQYGCDGLDSGDIDGDGDGDSDIVVGNVENGVRIWLNKSGTGTFYETGSYFDPGTIKVKLLDADLDGDMDLITANLEDGNKLWENQGLESFISIGQTFGTQQAHCLAIGNLDTDGDIDVVVGSASRPGSQEIYMNEQDA